MVRWGHAYLRRINNREGGGDCHDEAFVTLKGLNTLA